MGDDKCCAIATAVRTLQEIYEVERVALECGEPRDDARVVVRSS